MIGSSPAIFILSGIAWNEKNLHRLYMKYESTCQNHRCFHSCRIRKDLMNIVHEVLEAGLQGFEP